MHIVPKRRDETLAEYALRVRSEAKNRQRMERWERHLPPPTDDGPDDLCEAAIKIMRGERV